MTDYGFTVGDQPVIISAATRDEAIATLEAAHRLIARREVELLAALIAAARGMMTEHTSPAGQQLAAVLATIDALH